MIRITQCQATPDPITSVRPSQRGRFVYTLPARKLTSPEHQDDLQARGHILGMVKEQAIDIRVDWDGSESWMGRFEVQVGLDAWQQCELIDPDNRNDVVSPAIDGAGEIFLARFQRGPTYRSHSFGVKAIPIVWAYALPSKLDPAYVAVRGEDYAYASGANPELIPWTYSVLSSGTQTLAIELATGQDYEVWVRLQDPNDEANWRIQDPIVRTGGGGGHPY